MSTSDGSSADYYVLPPDSKQLQDLISHRDMNAQMGEIFRACYRYGIASHSDKMRDAKKIKFYIEAEIERLEKLIPRIEQPMTEIEYGKTRRIVRGNPETSTYCVHDTHLDYPCKYCQEGIPF